MAILFANKTHEHSADVGAPFKSQKFQLVSKESCAPKPAIKCSQQTGNERTYLSHLAYFYSIAKEPSGSAAAARAEWYTHTHVYMAVILDNWVSTKISLVLRPFAALYVPCAPAYTTLDHRPHDDHRHMVFSAS